MNCDGIRQQLPFFAYGELSFDEEERVQQHIESCKACESELQRLQALHQAVDDVQVQIDPNLLANCRRNLRLSVGAAAEANAARTKYLPAWLSSLLPSFAVSAKPFGAVALVALGFFGARLVPGDAGIQTVDRASFEPVASRVRYVEPDGSGQVQIVVEETRQRVMSGDMADDSIRRLLLAAARESADPGVRAETVTLLKSQSQMAEVRRALLHAIQHDPNAGVRLAALRGLSTWSKDAETRQVLAQVLLTDTNPGIRTQAVDLLTQSRDPEPELVGVLQELMTREENNYVRLKCQKVLSEVNASVETF